MAELTRSKVVAGQGWGAVRIGARRSEIEALLGKPDAQDVDSNYDASRYLDVQYWNLGVNIYYDTKLDRAVEVTFVNGSTDMVGVGYFGDPEHDPGFTPFKGNTDRGIGWASTPTQVKAAYGTKGMRDFLNDSDGRTEARDIQYPGITFYFPDGRHLELIYVDAK